MIPVLYEKNEEHFRTNGICRLVDCMSCEATEERNGIYEVEFRYPVNGAHFSEITLGRIIYVTHDETKIPQPFDIYKRSAEIDGVVTFNASHVSNRLGSTILRPYTAGSCADALDKMTINALGGTRFVFWTDKSVEANFDLKYPQNIRATLSGVTGSILDVFGTGEYEFDKWTVRLYAHRGSDTSVQLRYGKNLSDITAEADESGTYNSVIAYWHSEETGETVTVPVALVAENTESKIDAWTDENETAITNENGEPLEFNALKLRTYTLDLTQEFMEKPTVADLETLARKKFSSSKPWESSESISVDFVQLWQTEEYASVAPLQRLRLCDTATVLYPQANINVRKKVIRVVYDSLLERYSEMELGTPSATLSETIRDVTLQASMSTMTSISAMTQQAVSRATEMITGGLGGYVVIHMINDRPAEILVLDTPDIESAVNVIRVNQNGVGFSRNGYNGEYRNAWTIDGILNADFIQAGTLSADRIYGGIIRALSGDSSWNLETGDFTNGGSKSRIHLAEGQVYLYSAEDREGMIRTVIPASGVHDGGIALIGADNKFATLAAVTGIDEQTGVEEVSRAFTANDCEMYGYTEIALIEGEARFLRPVHMNQSLSFDYLYDDERKKFLQIGRISAGYWGSAPGISVLIKAANHAEVDVEKADGTVQRVFAINANPSSAAFGRIHFLNVVEFGDALFSGNTAASGYSFGSSRLQTRQFIIEDGTASGIMDSTTYGLRVVKGIYTDSKISCTTLTQRSDERLKDFRPWDDRYDEILNLVEPQLYTWKEGTDRTVHVGLSAQKLKKAIEDCGITDSGIVADEEYLAIAYMEIPLLMMRKVKKQQDTIADLENRIRALERRLESLCGYMNYQPEQ